ncbi:Pycsar system effector family protein [Mucilaginibacter panaciglaebae]|uniref:Pycsar effector protein domain-containing protein n=1 Tax=Mucilaginibacter panaciglaebae TaxID=502331 RepID=A0ABP7WE48_9SPHI
MNYQQLLEDVRKYVLNHFKTHHDDDLLYHDLQHTKDVVGAATMIANHYQLSDEDFFVVITGAWFHDTGYFVDKADHETAGANLAAGFLKSNNVDKAVIDKVKACILATRMPQQPNGLLQEILCDADLHHLGTPEFMEKSKKLRKEIERTKKIEIDKPLWLQKNIEFLHSHKYFTDYAQLLLADKQKKNLRKLTEKQTEDMAGATQAEQKDVIEKADDRKKEKEGTKAEKDEKKKKKDNEKPEKGIETMFRITSNNNQRLSDMADNKAHILITVNSIILSAIISLVLRKLEENGFLAIPSFILLTVSLLSMIFSILATRPSIPQGTFTQQEVDDKKVNLLFFGNFYKMGLEEYTAGMLKVMDDRAFLYGTLIKDVYSQGVVLGRKYRLLRVAYNIFMFGLIVAVIAFIMSSAFHDNATSANH